MEGSEPLCQARGLIQKVATDGGAPLDEPVVDYLAELLVVTVNDPSESNGLCEAMSDFLPGIKEVESVVHQLMENMLHPPVHSGGTGLKIESTSTSVQMDQPSSSSDGLGSLASESHCTNSSIGAQTEDLASTVAAVKLNASAKEFVPMLIEKQVDDESAAYISTGHTSFSDDQRSDISQEEHEEDLQGIWGGEDSGSIDALGLLSCLYPTFSLDALQSLLLVHHNNLGLTIRVLGQMGTEMQSPKTITKTEVPEKIVDMSESAFPTLPGSTPARKEMADVQQHSNKTFVAALKKMSTEQPPKMKHASPNPDRNSSRFWQGSKSAIPWVETGEEVSKQYAEAREEAREYARRRNAYFEQATKAYLSGNKALAKELGANGRWCCERMKECHAVAAEGIFQERNKRFKNGQPGMPQVLDLHGLHMSEARHILHRELGAMSRSGGKLQTVSLLVGTGHHTKGSRTPSRLPGAVRRFLDDEGYAHKTDKPGVIEVRL